MVYAVTQYKKNLSVVDNCCGSGTILCEALLQNYSIYGGDIDPQSVKIAKKNIDSINSKAVQHIKQLDCQKSPWQSQFFDCAISNLPYGKQVTVDHQTTLYAKTVEEYARIIKPKGSICLLGTHPEVIQKYAKKYLPNHKCKFFALGFLGQTPYLSCIHPK